MLNNFVMFDTAEGSVAIVAEDIRSITDLSDGTSQILSYGGNWIVKHSVVEVMSILRELAL